MNLIVSLHEKVEIRIYLDLTLTRFTKLTVTFTVSLVSFFFVFF